MAVPWKNLGWGLVPVLFLAWGWQIGLVNAEDVAAPTPAPTREKTPALYQLLYDEHFTPPLNELGQKVRIWIWLREMQFDGSQLRRLQRMSERYHQATTRLTEELDQLLITYEAQLVPQYQQLYTALQKGDPSQAELSNIAENLELAAITTRRDVEMREKRLAVLREILNDEREFLHTLSPEQEQKLVTALFFLRHTIDPFTAPGTYKEVVGSVWNAGDFTSLMDTEVNDVDHLDIGGLWGIKPGRRESPDYSQIRRGVVLFYVLREPVLATTITELLNSQAAASLPADRPMGAPPGGAPAGGAPPPGDVPPPPPPSSP